MKKEEHVVPIVHTKVVEPITEVTTQLIKPAKIPLWCPCVICYSFEHHTPNCPRKTKVHNMFQTKPTTIATIITKPSKPNNVPINVIVVMTHSQVRK
jgi:hypothetical protein